MKTRVQKFLKNTRRFILRIPVGSYNVKQAAIIIASPIIILVCIIAAAIATLFEKIKYSYNHYQYKPMDICYTISIAAVCLTLAFIGIYSEIYDAEAKSREEAYSDIPRITQTTTGNNMDYMNNKPIQIPSIDNLKRPTTCGIPTCSICGDGSDAVTTTSCGDPTCPICDNNIITTEKPPESSNPITTTERVPETSTPEITTTIPEVNEGPETIVSKYTTHIITSKDNFYNLSIKYYGDSKYYKAVMEYNKCDENTILHIGDKIIIPDIEDEEFISIYNRIDKAEREEINSFIESTKGQTIQAGNNNTYKYGVRTDPTVDIVVPSGNNMKNYTGEVDTSKFKLLGNYSTTGYTPTCMHCCGSDKGIGAAGVPIICGYSVAAPDNIPLGTTLYIEGYGFYVVEDRGNFGYTNIDIACPSHDDCAIVTNIAKDVKVYIVPNN